MGEIYKDNGRLSLRHKSEDIVMTVKHCGNDEQRLLYQKRIDNGYTLQYSVRQL